MLHELVCSAVVLDPRWPKFSVRRKPIVELFSYYSQYSQRLHFPSWNKETQVILVKLKPLWMIYFNKITVTIQWMNWNTFNLLIPNSLLIILVYQHFLLKRSVHQEWFQHPITCYYTVTLTECSHNSSFWMDNSLFNHNVAFLLPHLERRPCNYHFHLCSASVQLTYNMYSNSLCEDQSQ